MELEENNCYYISISITLFLLKRACCLTQVLFCHILNWIWANSRWCVCLCIWYSFKKRL